VKDCCETGERRRRNRAPFYIVGVAIVLVALLELMR
jgi:hypothetical protein